METSKIRDPQINTVKLTNTEKTAQYAVNLSLHKKDKYFSQQSGSNKNADCVPTQKFAGSTDDHSIPRNVTPFPNFSIPPPAMFHAANQFFAPPPQMWPMHQFNPYAPVPQPNVPFPSLPIPPQMYPSNICSLPPTVTFPNEKLSRNCQLPERKHFYNVEARDSSHKFSEIESTFFSGKKSDCDIPQVQLWRASSQIRAYYNILESIQNDVAILEYCCNDECDEKWRWLCAQIAEKQSKLKALKECMNFTPANLQLLKRKWNKRRKKRKLAKQERRSGKMFSKYEIADLHMQQLLRNAERIEQEQTLKKEADSVLSSVLQKKSAARNQIQLLTAVLKLHSARIHSQSIRSQSFANTSVSGFQKIVEKLKMLWEAHIKEYEIEENGLKIMLEESAVNAEDENCKKLKKTFGKWLNLMFGTSDLQKDQFCSDVNQFIEIRQNWDKYVVQHSTEGSKIPSGWVMPKYNSDGCWSKFISN